MHEPERYWTAWAQSLHNRGIKDLAATLLDALGPLRLLLAQVLFAGLPFLDRQNGDNSQWQAFVKVLENPELSRSFTTFLRKENIDS